MTVVIRKVMVGELVRYGVVAGDRGGVTGGKGC